MRNINIYNKCPPITPPKGVGNSLFLLKSVCWQVDFQKTGGKIFLASVTHKRQIIIMGLTEILCFAKIIPLIVSITAQYRQYSLLPLRVARHLWLVFTVGKYIRVSYFCSASTENTMVITDLMSINDEHRTQCLPIHSDPGDGMGVFRVVFRLHRVCQLCRQSWICSKFPNFGLQGSQERKLLLLVHGYWLGSVPSSQICILQGELRSWSIPSKIWQGTLSTNFHSQHELVRQLDLRDHQIKSW